MAPEVPGGDQVKANARWRSLERKKPRLSANRRCAGYDGFVYDSRAERDYGDRLLLLQKAGQIDSFKRQVTIPIQIDGETITRYRADFVVTHLDGAQEVIEVKGFETELWLIKQRLMRLVWCRQNPEATFTVVRV